jgi:hypothetical protein
VVVNSVGVFSLPEKEGIDLTLEDSTEISNIKRTLTGSEASAIVTKAK